MPTIFLLPKHMTLPRLVGAAGQSEASPVLRVFAACLGSMEVVADSPTEAIRDNGGVLLLSAKLRPDFEASVLHPLETRTICTVYVKLKRRVLLSVGLA